MKRKDLQERMQFARKFGNKPAEFWKRNINFYLDGTSFTHKSNPHDKARSTRTMVWRKKSEGLDINCTTKGRRLALVDAWLILWWQSLMDKA